MGFLLPAIGLGASLIGGIAKHKQEKKQAEAQRQAEEQKFQRESAAWDVGQNQRVERLNAIQGLLQRTQPFLRSGAGAAAGTGPDYTFDPAVLQRLQQKTPYPGSMPADPRAGLGWGAVAGGANSVADMLLAALAKKQAEGGAISGQPRPGIVDSSGRYIGE